MVKGSSTYKLQVPSNVEEKIRYLIRKFPHTEWSGVLFYTHTGSFEDGDLTIICRDIFPMDLGDATFTSFNMSEDVAAYMAENIELFDYDTGILHSHHTMSSLASGTDINTLQKEGNNTNCFVSLIVNTAGTYSAYITRKIQTKSEVTIKKLGGEYEFFGEGTIRLGEEEPQSQQIVNSEKIEYYEMDVEREVVDNPYDYLDERFKEIEKKKETEKKYNWSNFTPGTSYTPYSYKEPVQQTLPFYRGDNVDDVYNWWDDDEKSSSKKSQKEATIEDFDYTPDPTFINHCVAHMLICSLIPISGRYNIKDFVENKMDRLYNNMFGEDEFSFQAWVDFILDYTMFYSVDATAPKEFVSFQEDEYHMLIADAILKTLEPYRENNHYIASYYERLESYIA